MKQFFAAALGSLYFFSIICSANAQGAKGAKKSAEALLSMARLRPTTHPVTLSAEIRGGEEPLVLTFKIEEGHIKYQLHDPDETIILTLEPTTSVLSEVKDGSRSIISDSRRYQEVRGTGVTYDDLSLSFLYWPHPRLAGEERLRGISTAIIELSPPSQATPPYGSARLWVDPKSGAPIRMEGWNHQGQLIKRFEVISAQKIDRLWMLKEMRIESLDPATGKVTQRRYLTLHSDDSQSRD